MPVLLMNMACRQLELLLISSHLMMVTVNVRDVNPHGCGCVDLNKDYSEVRSIIERVNVIFSLAT